jgi:hypothetical protein
VGMADGLPSDGRDMIAYRIDSDSDNVASIPNATQFNFVDFLIRGPPSLPTA